MVQLNFIYVFAESLNLVQEQNACSNLKSKESGFEVAKLLQKNW